MLLATLMHAFLPQKNLPKAAAWLPCNACIFVASDQAHCIEVATLESDPFDD